MLSPLVAWASPPADEAGCHRAHLARTESAYKDWLPTNPQCCYEPRSMDLRSPAVGKVIRLSVEIGATVQRGDELMVIESMKVEIPIKATIKGVLKEFRV